PKLRGRAGKSKFRGALPNFSPAKQKPEVPRKRDPICYSGSFQLGVNRVGFAEAMAVVIARPVPFFRVPALREELSSLVPRDLRPGEFFPNTFDVFVPP